MAKIVQNRFAGYKTHFMTETLRYETHDFQEHMWKNCYTMHTSANMSSLGLDFKHGLDF
jgi:hypothetical protein